MKKRTTILYVHYGDNWIRGSEQCLIDLITNLDRDRFHPMVWTNNPALVAYLELANIDHQLDKFPLLLGWRTPTFDVKSWFSLVKKGRKMITENQASIVHVNSGAPCQWMALAARSCHCPMVTHLHSDYQSRDRVTLGLHISPHIITASNAISQNLRRDGYPEEQLSVIHNGVNVEELERQPAVDVRKRLNLDSEDTIFSTVGSLITRKGIDRIIQALRYLTLEYPNSHLVVIGDGDQKATLIELTRKMHLTDRVHFVGEQHNVVGWLKGSDAFVSGARQEAFGLVITEAAIAKIPIIAPFEGGIPEIVQHGESAMLYVNTGYAPLLNMMRCIHSHKGECQKLAEHAYQMVSTQFNHQRYVNEMTTLYQDLINQRKPSHPSPIAGCKSIFKPIKTALANRSR